MTRIIVAEDEANLRRFYERFLSKDYRGEELLFVETGDEAVSALEEMLERGEKPNLVVTDNIMPPGKITGMGVIDFVKGRFPGTNVVMVASENREATVGKTALEKGASAYLPKPVEIKAFLETVKKYAGT